MPRSYPGSTLGVDLRSQGVIPRRFKRKKNFVTDAQRTDRWTDRRDSRNSYVDMYIQSEHHFGRISLILSLLWANQTSLRFNVICFTSVLLIAFLTQRGVPC